MGYQKPRQVFTTLQEDSLTDYALRASKIFYGISPQEMKSLAYEFAVANDINIPEGWNTKKSASNDWFSAFMKRHKNLSLRVPESTSLSRRTSFNKHNVQSFFNNLETVLLKHNRNIGGKELLIAFTP